MPGEIVSLYLRIMFNENYSGLNNIKTNWSVLEDARKLTHFENQYIYERKDPNIYLAFPK